MVAAGRLDDAEGLLLAAREHADGPWRSATERHFADIETVRARRAQEEARSAADEENSDEAPPDPAPSDGSG